MTTGGPKPTAAPRAGKRSPNVIHASTAVTASCLMAILPKGSVPPYNALIQLKNRRI
jgi:hypothetical protein